MATAAKDEKVLWVMPKNFATSIIGVVIVAVVAGFIWAALLGNIDFLTKNTWIYLIMVLLLAAVIGYASGMIVGASKQVHLWIAAGFGWMSYVLLGGLLTSGVFADGGAPWDRALASALGGNVFSLEGVSGIAIVVGAVAAAFAVVGSKSKM